MVRFVVGSRSTRAKEKLLYLCETCGALLFVKPEKHANCIDGTYVNCDGEFTELHKDPSDLEQVFNPKTKRYMLMDKATGDIIHRKELEGKYDYIAERQERKGVVE